MSEEITDVLAAMLAPYGYDSFSVEEDCLKAYCPQDQFSSENLNQCVEEFPISDVIIQWSAQEMETQNWNETWENETQFEPIIIDDRCVIRTPSVQDVPQCKHDIVIMPKMSFGSGHHETTSQLLEMILDLPLKGKNVLDMGCGTAVLGILAASCGAAYVRAIEIDDWVAANAVDNVLMNDMAGRVKVECGDASLLGDGQKYDYIFANINRNVLLADMATYVSDLVDGGSLLMSGFYEEDIPSIRQCAESLGLQYVGHKSRSNWVVIRFDRSAVQH